MEHVSRETHLGGTHRVVSGEGDDGGKHPVLEHTPLWTPAATHKTQQPSSNVFALHHFNFQFLSSKFTQDIHGLANSQWNENVLIVFGRSAFQANRECNYHQFLLAMTLVFQAIKYPSFMIGGNTVLKHSPWGYDLL